MRQYLLDYFSYNDRANNKLLETILQLPDTGEALRLFSHLIYAQDKWYNRVAKQHDDKDYQWHGPAFAPNVVADKWNESYERWLALLNDANTDVETNVIFTRPVDGVNMQVKLKDIIFQLNCHSVHHRAQINRLISAQGVAVPQTDYIFTAISQVQ